MLHQMRFDPRPRKPRSYWQLSKLSAASTFFALALTPMSAHSRAPLVAPEPPRKLIMANSSDNGSLEVLQKPEEIDAARARELLMQQLLRAAEAGIVDMQPVAQTADPEGITPDDHRNGTRQQASPSQISSLNEEETQSSDATLEENFNETLSVSPVETPHAAMEEIADLAQRIKASGELATEIMTPRAGETPQPVPEVTSSVTTSPATCFSHTQLHLPDVMSGEHLSHLISEQRRNLIGEFDVANSDHAIALAKTYLSAGMALEAKVIIDEFAADSPIGQFLMDVAQVWLGLPISSGSSLLKEECIGIQALWRAFAQARRGDLEEATRSEVSSGAALEDLPLHVRQVVSSDLGLVAANMGQWDNARRFLAMAKRAATGEGRILGGTHLLAFRLAKWRNDDAEAKEHLARADASDPDTAIQALLIRAENALRSEDVLDPSHVDLRLDLGALARSEVDTDIAKRAFELEARLFNRTADAEQTIDFLSDAVDLGLLDAKDHASFLSELISKPAYSDTARPLAHIYLDDPGRFVGAIHQPALRKSLVRSLANEGVPSVASKLLHNEDLRDPSVAIQLAQGFVDVDDHRSAIATLSEADDGVSQRLILSQAFVGMGDFKKAISVLNEIPDEIDVTTEDALRISEARLKAEIAGGDFTSAYASAERLLAQQSDQEMALQAALYALENGATELPIVVRNVLANESSEGLRLLEDIYSINQEIQYSTEPDIGKLINFINVIKENENSIMDFINNG